MGAKSTTPIRRFGAWLVRSDATVYQAATDGFVVVYAITSEVGGILNILTDAANPPVTLRQQMYQSASSAGVCATCPVKKNHYWKTTGENLNTPFIFWLPLEP